MSEIKIGTGNGQGSCYGCEQYTLIALEEILDKYKEIIGGDNK